jgi:K+-transporting ATPase KdpF subunit
MMPLALAMSGNDLVGLIIAVLVTAYLVYALLAPEKL